MFTKLGKSRKLAGLAAALVVAAVAWPLFAMRGYTPLPRTQVTAGRFEDVVRAKGSVQPFKTTSVRAKVPGTLLRLVQDGARVEKGGLLLEIDPLPLQEQLANQEALLARIKAENEKDRQVDAKNLRSAQDAERQMAEHVELEQLKLKAMELGPSATQMLDAKEALQNAQDLRKALADELDLMTALAEEARYSKAMLEQKRLDLNEQQIKVEAAQIALEKLVHPDTLAVTEQRQAVQDAQHRLEAAHETAVASARNLKKNTDAFAARLKQEEDRRADFANKIKDTKVVAKGPGYAIIGSRRGVKYGPGLSVGSREVLTFSDLSKLKAVAFVDEGRIGKLKPGMDAVARFPSGSETVTLKGKVVTVAEHGSDEFDDYMEETRDLIGRADRQVFKVEIELTCDPLPVRLGQKVDVEVIVNAIDQALLVPRTALFNDPESGRCVWREAGRRPERVNVKVLAENEGSAAIEGLNEGDTLRLTPP